MTPIELRNLAANAERRRPCGCERPHPYETEDGELVCFTCGRSCSSETAEAWWKGDERFGGPVRTNEGPLARY